MKNDINRRAVLLGVSVVATGAILAGAQTTKARSSQDIDAEIASLQVRLRDLLNERHGAGHRIMGGMPEDDDAFSWIMIARIA